MLARLRDDPSAAVPEPGVAEVLARLAAVDGVTVALVSGRGVADLQTTSGLSGPFRWVGSHGAEFDGPLSGELAARRDELAARLAPLVAGDPGCPAGGQAGERGGARPAGRRPRRGRRRCWRRPARWRIRH